MKCILISGASGAVGSALAPLFVNAACDVKIVLRAETEFALQKRLRALLDFWRLDGRVEKLIEPIRGDVTQPRWGIACERYEQLTREVTHIIHAAGNVRLNESLADARRSAVDSARFAVELARACQPSGKFEKLDLVSTVGVAGRTPGLIEERPYTESRSFHNTYEAAKAEAEELLLAEMAEGLPATVHRPSMVVGDSANGRIIHFQVFYFLSDFLAGLKTCGLVPRMGDAKLDIVPADYVARAIYISSGDPASLGKIFHLCTGPEGSWRIADLATELRTMLRQNGHRIPPLRWIPRGIFRALLCAAPLASRKNRRFLKNLPYFLDYLQEQQLFDNKVAAGFLSTHGLHAPEVADYLPRIMGAYWAQRIP
jgi:thioester reductase-like protein